MKRVLALAGLLCFASIAFGQSQYAQITSNKIADAAGNKLSSGTITFTPVNNAGTPIAPQAVSGGRVVPRPVVFKVIAGVITPSYGTAQLVDVTQAYPANFCYTDTIHDNISGNTWSPDSCVQPAYNASWCSVTGGATTCNFDLYAPTSTPGVTVQAPSLIAGTFTTGAAGSAVSCTVNIAGSAPNYALSCSVPQGIQGVKGDPGVVTCSAGTCGTNGDYNVAGKMSASTVVAATTNNIVNAAQYAGSDCGAKIVAADAAWIASPVEIDVNQTCGNVWTTPIILSTNHNLKFTQGGTYVLPSGNVVKGNNDVSGIGSQVVTQLAAAQPSAMFLTADGWHTTTGTNAASNVVFHDFTMDGNVTNNITTSCPSTVDSCAYGIYVNSTPTQAPSNIEIKNITFQNFHGPEVMVETGSNNIKGWPQASYVNIHDNKFLNEVWTSVKVYGFNAHMRIENNLFQNWDSLDIGYGLAIGWHSADSDDSGCTSSSPAATSDWKINNNRFLYPAQLYPSSTKGHLFATEMFGGSYPCDYVNGMEYTHNYHDAGGLSGGTGFSGGGSNSHIDDNVWVNSTGYGSRNGVEASLANGTISRNIILNGGIAAYSMGRNFTANHFDLVDNIVQNYDPNTNLSGMNALKIGSGTSSAPVSNVNITGGTYDISGQGASSGTGNNSIVVNGGTGYIKGLKIFGVKVLACGDASCGGIRIATASDSTSSGIEISNNDIQGVSGGASYAGILDGASGYPDNDTGVTVHDNKIINFSTPISLYTTGSSAQWGNITSATQTTSPYASIVIQGNGVDVVPSDGRVKFVPGSGANISALGNVVTIGATGIGSVVASIPTALYTAPIGCTAFAPAEGWTGGTYRVSGGITTTVASTVTGTMNTYLGYFQVDGIYRGPNLGGVINLQTVGSDSTNISPQLGQLTIQVKPGTPISYCTGIVAGTPTGYTYSGVWHLEHIGQ
jgi:hypothetical protein